MSENADKEKAIRILDYWFLMEFLNQQSIKSFIEIKKKANIYINDLSSGIISRPKKVVEDFIQLRDGDNLQTIAETTSKKTQLPIWSNFTVFIGRIKKQVCIQKIAQNVKWNGQSPDENYDEIALASLKISKDGSYITNSLSVSPLVWAMKKLSGETSNASQKLSIDEFNSDTRAIEERIGNMFKHDEGDDSASKDEDTFYGFEPVSYELLKKIEDMILEELGLKASDIQSFINAYFKLYASEDDIEEDESGVGLRLDFYSKDLAFAADGLRNNIFTEEKMKILLDYILGLDRYGNAEGKTPYRFDVVKPINEEELYHFMLEKLTAAKAPLGKWPSRFMPALMQQIAVNLATDEDEKLPVFSVNGPPGTGKTTLLKEIIVNNIVEKAILLAEYEEADDAFNNYSFSNGDGPEHSYNKYVRKYHRLKNKKINAYSVLVVSSNNTAVENITKELPIEKKVLEDIAPSEEGGKNNAALAELTELFTVSKSVVRLPFIKKTWKYTDKDGTKKKWCKEDAEELPDVYFSKFATDLLNAESENNDEQQAFGLISASLGKKSNIDKVETRVIEPLLDIMRKNDDITQRKKDYLEARITFLKQLELVKKLRIELDKLPVREKEVSELHREAEKKREQFEEYEKKQIVQLLEIDNDVQKRQESINQLNIKKNELEISISAIHSTCLDLEARIKAQQKEIADICARIDALHSSISLFGRLFKTAKYKERQESVDLENRTLLQCQQQIEALEKSLEEEKKNEDAKKNEINRLLKEISAKERALKELYKRRESIVSEGQTLERELAATRKEVEEQTKQLEEARSRYQNQDSYDQGFVLDHQFISDILSSDKDISTRAQIRNPWLSEHYNREREKLFLYALQMTKEFILSSKKCRDNFKHLRCLWSGSYDRGERVKFIGDDLQNCTAAAYETLFLLIPVVSSTFASVQSLFKNVKEENIVGTMIVDEAGQSSPHMAIGALCRSKKAVIVGDPKQVEPVVTDDQDLLQQTFTDDLLKYYKDKTNSVQRFADIINPYGTYLKNVRGTEEWVGCPLLVHRRCISPMYEISNDISYNNIMKQQTAQPKVEKQKMFIAEKSQWINVSGKEEGTGRHFVKEQGDKVIKMLEVAFSKNPDPDIFIISPFTTVVSGIKDYLKKHLGECRKKSVASSLLEHESSFEDWMEKNVGTVHKFQGKEAAEVIFLLGCDTSDDSASAIKWVNNNIVNVAATRAKYRFYVIGDIEAWNKSKCVKRAKKILDSYAAGSLGWVPKNYNPDDGYTLVITEKPSVAEAYAKALCVWNEQPNEFYEGNGFLISWCLGHLIELATPEQYDVKYKNWNIEDLPIIPDDWKYQIMDSRNPNEKKRIIQRFDVLKTLMNRDDVKTILCATDAGREGELIFRLVYQQTECKKPFKRIWLSSMEAASIRQAFENPNPSSDYDSLYESARCRQLADWIVGMNASRYYSLLHGNKKKALSVGRVMTPTMAMIVDREKEIEAFIPETYYTVNLDVGGVIFESGRFETEEEAIQVEQKCINHTCIVDSLNNKHEQY